MAVVTVDGRKEDDTYAARRAGTGAKTDTPLIETPQSISVILRERFEEQGAQTLRQTVNYSAGRRPPTSTAASIPSARAAATPPCCRTACR